MTNPWKRPHETAPQRRRRHKADPLRGHTLAPLVQKPTLCKCGDPRSLHNAAGKCQVRACGCAEYREATR